MRWYNIYPPIVLFLFIWIPISFTIARIRKHKRINFLRHPQQWQTHILLLSFLFTCLLISILEFLAYSFSNPKIAAVIYRPFYVIMLLCPTVYTHLLFSYPLPETSAKRPWSALFIYIPPLAISILTLSTDLIIKDMMAIQWGLKKGLGDFILLYRLNLLYVTGIGCIVVIKNISKYRFNPAIRNTLIHLLFAVLLPLVYVSLFVVLLPLAFDIWRLKNCTPSIPVFLMAGYISYAIMRGNLLDFSALVGPIFKNEKYLFHQELKQFIEDMTEADSLKSIIRKLSELLECSVFLYVNVAGDRYVISSEKHKLNVPFMDSDIRKEVFNPEDQAIASFLNDYNAERFFPIFHHNVNGLIIFGRNFTKKIHSSQDVRLINKLCHELKDAILILWNKRQPSPVLILKDGDELQSIVSDQCTEAKVLDLKTFKEQNIPTLSKKAFSEIMSSIISSRKFPAASILNLEVKIGEVVLIEVNGLPAVYAQVDNIQPAISYDEDLFIVTFLFLSTPPDRVIWNLSSGQLGGVPFMLNRKKIAITKLEHKKQQIGNVIPFPKYDKN